MATEAQREYNRMWREKNRDKIREYSRKYREENREHLRVLYGEGVKRWREENPELNKERNRLYRANRRARIAGARVEKYIQLKNLHNWESRLCGICHLNIEGDYQVDHIIPLSRGGEHSTANLQLAHSFCNQSKFNKLSS